MKFQSDIFAFVPVVRMSERPKEAVEALRRLGMSDVSLENRLEVRNQGNGEHEIVLIGAVGGSWWDESGITESEFRNALKSIPKGSKITLLINSEGGSVQEGLGIYNAIKERRAEITAKISGYAVSIASVFPLAASKVISPKSAIWMTHKAWSYAQGNDEDMDKAAQMLREHNETLVDIYVAETGKTKEEWEGWMKAETWIKGAKAIEYGLADETEEVDESQASYRQFHPDFIQRCKNISHEILNVISALPSQGKAQTNKQTEDTIMNRTQKIALLNGWGVNVKDEASVTDARLDELIALGKSAAVAAFSGTPAPVASNAQPAGVPQITKADVDNAVNSAVQAAERRAEVKASLAQLVTEKRITQAQADKALPAALKDDSVLATLRENPVMPVAAEPIATEVELTGDSVKDIENHIITNIKNQRAGVMASRPEQVRDCAMAAANAFQKHRTKLLGVLNANTISADLKRNVILNEILRAFATRILPLRAFSTVFQNVQLQGTDIVSVPYFALTGTASTDFVQANGYVMGDSAQDAKPVTINKRKYQPIRFNSSELSRQPAINLMQIAAIKAEKLGVDVFSDVLSVVTAANYGAASFTGAAATFDSADIADLKGVCDTAEWPDAGRSLIVKSTYDVNLLKDLLSKGSQGVGNNSAFEFGRVPQIAGFNYYMANSVPANAENLVGMCVFPSAILVATAPVMPSDEVRNQLSGYELVIDPTTGISFEYRRWGNPDMDETREVIECNYGFAKGEGAALKRLVSA